MSYAYINNPKWAHKNEELKSIYNKWRQRQFGKKIPVHIFGSGSEGNSIYLKPQHTLIDLGLPYKVYHEYDPTFFLDVDYILLTHHHGDHLNPATLVRVMDNHPHIRIIINPFMWTIITSDAYKTEYEKREPGEAVPFGHDATYKTDSAGNRISKGSKWASDFLRHQSKFKMAQNEMLQTHDGRYFLFEPLSVVHGDIINMAIQILDPDLELDLLYASDLDNLGGERTVTDNQNRRFHITGLRQDRMYTCMFIEANYDERILQEWYDNLDENDPDYRGKKARADGNVRHISEQETARYIEQFLSEGGLFVPLHASRTFGTLYQS